MLRREFLKMSALAASALFTGCESGLSEISSGGGGLNILWITCEDMSAHLGCYGDKTVATPNIDRLAGEGVLYTNAFATTGVCAPSRHALITGMYPTSTYALQMRNHARTGALKEIKDPATYEYASTRPLYEAVPPREVRCFTEYLRMAGYYCTNNSKEDYQFQAPVTTWDESSRKAHWRNRRVGQRFFSVFNFTVTHESGVFGKGRSPRVTDPKDVPVPPYYPDTPAVRVDIAKHYDNIIVLDRQVGDLVEQLEKDGLLNETIIFFFSDHGDGLPRSKRWIYDSGTRVPLIVRYPHKKNSGSRSDRLVSFVDFGPTVLSLLGIKVPDHVHGKAFLGGQAGEPRKYVYFHRDRNGENRETIRAIRDKRYRYVKNYCHDKPYIKPLAYRDRQVIMQELNRLIKEGALGDEQWQLTAKTKPAVEFYDVHEDPFEINNLASDSKYAGKIAEMGEALEAWVSECDDPLEMSEFELVQERVYPPEGKQPGTAKPVVKITSLGGKRIKVGIACETEGATIGYRLLKANGKVANGDAAWSVYDGSVEIEAAGAIEVIAHRIGFKASEKVERSLAGD